jgi:predicted esterase
MRQFLIGWLCALAVIAPSLARPSAEPHRETLRFGGENRVCYVFVPAGLTAPAPALLLLHGSGHNGMSLIEPWRGLAQKEGVILVAPDSSDSTKWDFRKDSLDFLHAVLEEIESKHAVDRRRVYLFGHSAGAMYALYLSVVESEYFAATAIHAGSLAEGDFKLIDSAKRRIPISIWVGTDDTFFPLPVVRATRDAFNARGFTVELHEISGHDHDYYRVASKVNGDAWQFLKTNKLEKDPDFVTLSQVLNPVVKVDSKGQANPDRELTVPAFEPPVWTSAKPYLDEPLPQLIATIPELHGLNPAPDQHPLTELLKKTGDKSLDLLRRMPNVISRENVEIKVEPRGPTAHQQFDYLVLRHEASGVVTLDEYRTDKTKAVTPVLSQGAANAWVLFHPGNLVESRFRYLGRQDMDGHATVVLGFAQIPDKVKFPGQVKFEGTSIPVLFQGIAWIDDSDFRIVRLRTDLLAPRPDIYLRILTREVVFSEVRILGNEAVDPLWLPQEVTVRWDFKGQVVRQIHRYSSFHLYRAKSKIVM